MHQIPSGSGAGSAPGAPQASRGRLAFRLFDADAHSCEPRDCFRRVIAPRQRAKAIRGVRADDSPGPLGRA